MAYGSNVLKQEAAYYNLNNATLSDGLLHIGAGGSATQILTQADLAALTSTMLFTCILDEYSDAYEPNIQILIHARMLSSSEYYNIYLYPVDVLDNKYECIFEIAEGEYSELYVTLSASKPVTFSLWELCPEAASSDIEVTIEGVKQGLPKLLFDYNTFPLEFQQAETTVALITCNLKQATDLQGHFTITFEASQTATVTIRFYDNESEELFAPVYADCRTGLNTIGIPHAFLSRTAGIHTFAVTMQMAAGTGHIDTRKVLFTIDGGYLATREIDVGMDVTDIAIRQLAIDNGPDQIWVVGLDAGEALVRYRNYKEENANVGWTAVGSLGRAVSAAIEFNGEWVLRPDAEQFTLETDEDPWLFWVDEYMFLYASHGMPLEDRSNVIELASDVTSDIKAVRGYSSIEFAEQDQGLIVAYIKNDGFAYYRSYSYDTTAHEPLWADEVALPVPAYSYNHINVHRLNDYRVGFELSGDERNMWLLTDRTYVGQSVYPETAYLSLEEYNTDYIPFLQYYPASYVPPIPNIIEVRSEAITIEHIVPQEQEHYFEYDYTNNVKGNDLGTVESVIAQYGAPERDDVGLYIWMTIVGPDSSTIVQKVYIKQYTVTVHVTEYENKWLLYAKLDQALWANDGLCPTIDRIVLNNNVVPYETIEGIEWKVYNTITEISIILTEVPLSLVVTGDLAYSPYWRLYDGNYVTTFDGDIHFVWDLTNYIVLPDQIESQSAVIKIDEVTLDYLQKRLLNGYGFETVPITESNTISYNAVIKSNGYGFEEVVIEAIQNLNYYKASEAPI